MRASGLIPLALLVPFTAIAQGPGAIDAAKRANAAEEAATEARMKAADDQIEAPEQQQSPVELGGAAAQLEGEPAPAPVADDAAHPGSAEPPPAEAYTVKQGDTLWDLSGRFLNNPWYWPKVWSYNPEISNPHFIYPGNVVRLHPGGEEGPARVEPVQQVAGGEDLHAPRELDDFSRADMKKPQDYGEGDEVAVVGPYKIGYVPPKGIFARRDSFVTPRELQESGTIIASFEEKLLLSLHDRAYVRFADSSKVKPGESYVV